ncbi:MAG TPA: S1 RNA-binding domain-containing protein [Acidimicrobiales bacterium]|nr:S1 RNA-binding domain-containing protein [Acidimicrobiales bacterium]
MKITHVIVDGSNIATEGRDAPSLAQLDEAVQAFVEEYSPDHVTVVVDATFPNRIDRRERKTYEDAVNANELITPPAGAIGRGDAFILQIAKRAGATILSNDSFQEFHGDYPWLFERGRLIGGKPVPHVGWVFMDRAPVRGPTSRRAVSEAKKVAKAAEQAAEQVVADLEGDEAASSPPPRRRRSRAKAKVDAPVPAERTAEPSTPSDDGQDRSEVARVADEVADEGNGSRGRGRALDPYNEALPFIEFVAQHPVGSEVDATIERFSSHGAYVLVGSARGYVPLRNLADPAPRSAKEVVRVGEERRFVVVAIDPPRRGIDLALPGVVEVPAPDLADTADLVAELAVDVTDAADEVLRAAEAAEGAALDTPARGRKAAARKTTARKATARKATAKKAAAKAATKAATKKAPAKKSPAKQATTATKGSEKPAPATATKKATRASKATAEPAAPAATDAPARKAAKAPAKGKAGSRRTTAKAAATATPDADAPRAPSRPGDTADADATPPAGDTSPPTARRSTGTRKKAAAPTTGKASGRTSGATKAGARASKSGSPRKAADAAGRGSDGPAPASDPEPATTGP